MASAYCRRDAAHCHLLACAAGIHAGHVRSTSLQIWQPVEGREVRVRVCGPQRSAQAVAGHLHHVLGLSRAGWVKVSEIEQECPLVQQCRSRHKTPCSRVWGSVAAAWACQCHSGDVIAPMQLQQARFTSCRPAWTLPRPSLGQGRAGWSQRGTVTVCQARRRGWRFVKKVSSNATSGPLWGIV